MKATNKHESKQREYCDSSPVLFCTCGISILTALMRGSEHLKLSSTIRSEYQGGKDFIPHVHLDN
jgi:hypothetical protein